MGGSPGHPVGNDGLGESGLATHLAPTPPTTPSLICYCPGGLGRQGGAGGLDGCRGTEGQADGSKCPSAVHSERRRQPCRAKPCPRPPGPSSPPVQHRPLEVTGRRAGGELSGQRALGCVLKSAPSRLVLTQSPVGVGHCVSPFINTRSVWWTAAALNNTERHVAFLMGH